jgi:hypothetical protein
MPTVTAQGAPDGKIDAADRTYIGSPVPKLHRWCQPQTYLWSVSMLKHTCTLSIGNKIFNLSKWFTEFASFIQGCSYRCPCERFLVNFKFRFSEPDLRRRFQLQHKHTAELMVCGRRFFLPVQNLSVGYTLSGDAMKAPRCFTRPRIRIGQQPDHYH